MRYHHRGELGGAVDSLWLSAEQDEGPHETLNLPARGTGTSQLPERWQVAVEGPSVAVVMAAGAD